MLERWKNQLGKEIEVYEEFRFLTSELNSGTAFGSSYLEGKSIFEMMMMMKLTLLQTTIPRDQATFFELSQTFSYALSGRRAPFVILTYFTVKFSKPMAK
ncbi:hypothetical protein TorRG33x02_070030 [Trema orientale]|uniref:Cytochrome P n=1 Tax=Trema orientale TaxID=63057 RepID=A0A2P5FHH8_TREOI|nr:hypothetical protein TorRG33x02_070030 [Trema orientale]